VLKANSLPLISLTNNTHIHLETSPDVHTTLKKARAFNITYRKTKKTRKRKRENTGMRSRALEPRMCP